MEQKTERFVMIFNPCRNLAQSLGPALEKALHTSVALMGERFIGPEEQSCPSWSLVVEGSKNQSCEPREEDAAAVVVRDEQGTAKRSGRKE